MDALDKAETRRLLLQTPDRRAAAPSRLHPRAGWPARRRRPSAPEPPSRLDQLRPQLAELRARYTDRHPDVIRAQAEIAQLEALEKRQPARPPQRRRRGHGRADGRTTPRPRPDPMLKAELASVDLEIRSLKTERERILADTARVQGRLETVPRVEQELLSLTRDYDNIKSSYESLLDKRLNARLYENLEKSQQGEQLHHPRAGAAAERPLRPQQDSWCWAWGWSPAASAACSRRMLRERTDPTYLDAASLQQAFPGLPLLATIPVFPRRRSDLSDRRR